MIKKTLKFKDLDGNPVEKDYYFHLNQSDLVELQLDGDGSLSEKLKQVTESGDGGKIIAAFKDFIRASVGRRSEDNLSFIKSKEVQEAFIYSEAYSALLMELLTQPDSALAFVKGIMPSEIIEKADLSELEALATKPDVKVELPPIPAEKEITEMSVEELRAALASRTEV